MKSSVDLEYLCVNLGNLSAMPIRLYDGEKELFYYSIIALPKDPFTPYIKDVFAIADHVGYFVAPHDYYYGVVNFGKKRIVVGPTKQLAADEQELKEIAFETGVHHADLDDFVKGMKSINPMPLMSILQMLSIVNHVLNDGEKLSLTDVTIYDLEQEKMVDALAKEDIDRAIKNATEKGFSFAHNSMDVEEYMLSAVRKGDTAGLERFFKNMPAIRSGVMAQDALRQSKDLFIVSAALVSREAIRGGMNAEEALTLSDSYVRKCEILNSPEAVTNLNYRIIMDYAERMERLQYGGKPSKLVNEVVYYVRRHLSEPITVEELARFLCRGRSRLSTDFKKETGENLSEFILKQKIEEGKRLLRYTDKPSVEIALYLGFSSQSHFSRTFKKYVSLTPNEYRVTRKNNVKNI